MHRGPLGPVPFCAIATSLARPGVGPVAGPEPISFQASVILASLPIGVLESAGNPVPTGVVDRQRRRGFFRSRRRCRPPPARFRDLGGTRPPPPHLLRQIYYHGSCGPSKTWKGNDPWGRIIMRLKSATIVGLALSMSSLALSGQSANAAAHNPLIVWQGGAEIISLAPAATCAKANFQASDLASSVFRPRL